VSNKFNALFEQFFKQRPADIKLFGIECGVHGVLDKNKISDRNLPVATISVFLNKFRRKYVSDNSKKYAFQYFGKIFVTLGPVSASLLMAG
jgi:hypothetical protein